MFVDKTQVTVIAGNGGDGVVSFRHEKFVDRGGPDGGDGGNGGDVVLQASRNQNTLAKFRYQRRLKAENGKNGSKQKKHGRSGKNLVILVPVGTVAIDQNNQVKADLTKDGQTEVIALGGKGGFGNAHFVSSRRQAPKIAEKGEQGEYVELTLELKIIADVGLIGLPNAGKSTLLGAISNAKPKIADYAFTTLTPNLGMVDLDNESSLLLADIPGLIEGASEGKGLGDEFLKHIERTSVLIHLIDAYSNDLIADYEAIINELKSYKVDLSKKPQILAINKIDGLDDDTVNDLRNKLSKSVPKNTDIFAISALSKKGVMDLIYQAAKIVIKTKNKEMVTSKLSNKIPIIKLPMQEDGWEVIKTKSGFLITGIKIEKFAKRTDFDNPEGIKRLRDIMKKTGIIHELIRQKISPGQKIIIGKDKIGEFKY